MKNLTYDQPDNPDEIEQDAKYVLFVEGQNGTSFDREIIHTFLTDNELLIKVQALGSCRPMQQAALALYTYNPDYFFLIDRDDNYSDNMINKNWENFPDPNFQNLLIWRCRELENYFLFPEYISQSQWFRRTYSQEKLRKLILEEANKRVYLDALNIAIMRLRSNLEHNGIESLSDKKLKECTNKTNTLSMFWETENLKISRERIIDKLEDANFIKEFDNVLENLFGEGQTELTFGMGKWLQMINPKPILDTVLGRCFEVKNAKDKVVIGTERKLQVAKDLVRMPLAKQPEDFQELYRKISERLRA